MASWLPWPFSQPSTPKPPMRATEAMNDPALRMHFEHLLLNRKQFCPSEVAGELSVAELENLGYEKWQHAMPAVLELLAELRALGDCEIVQNGKVVDEEVGVGEIRGPMRVRRPRG